MAAECRSSVIHSVIALQNQEIHDKRTWRAAKRAVLHAASSCHNEGTWARLKAVRGEKRDLRQLRNFKEGDTDIAWLSCPQMPVWKTLKDNPQFKQFVNVKLCCDM